MLSMPNHDDSLRQLQEQLAAFQRRVAELEDAEARYQLLFEGAGDAILIVETATSEIVDANANALRRLGYTREQLLGTPISDIEIQSEAVEADAGFHWKSIASGVVISECHYQRQDGSLWPTEVSISFIRVGKRTLQQNVVRDITERKEVEQQRVVLAVERNRVDMLADFITNVSHEFKTPLSVINTGLYLLEKTLDDDDARDRVSLINDQIMYINHLIDAMLTMSQLDSRSDTSFVRFDLNEIVREVISVAKAMVEPRQQQLHSKLHPDLLIVAGAKDDLYLAIYQLVDNAVAFTADGGSITVETSRNADMAQIDIIDNGIGISDADLPRIFERFFRADQARTTRRVGLGLSMCKKVIDIHGGKIEVDSVLDEGSQFRIYLPLLD
jgi:PAS domain S-box-containing protein